MKRRPVYVVWVLAIGIATATMSFRPASSDQEMAKKKVIEKSQPVVMKKANGTGITPVLLAEAALELTPEYCPEVVVSAVHVWNWLFGSSVADQLHASNLGVDDYYALLTKVKAHQFESE